MLLKEENDKGLSIFSRRSGDIPLTIPLQFAQEMSLSHLTCGTCPAIWLPNYEIFFLSLIKKKSVQKRLFDLSSMVLVAQTPKELIWPW